MSKRQKGLIAKDQWLMYVSHIPEGTWSRLYNLTECCSISEILHKEHQKVKQPLLCVWLSAWQHPAKEEGGEIVQGGRHHNFNAFKEELISLWCHLKCLTTFLPNDETNRTKIEINFIVFSVFIHYSYVVHLICSSLGGKAIPWHTHEAFTSIYCLGSLSWVAESDCHQDRK